MPQPRPSPRRRRTLAHFQGATLPQVIAPHQPGITDILGITRSTSNLDTILLTLSCQWLAENCDNLLNLTHSLTTLR